MKIDALRMLLEKYQQGLCTEEERKAIEEWYDSLQIGEEHPLTDAELGDSLMKIRRNLPDIAGRKQDIMKNQPPVVGGRMPDRVDGRMAKRADGWKMRAGVVAAALFLLASALWLIYLSIPKKRDQLAVLPGTDTVITTSRGETRQIILPDGSTIQLNAATAFSYPRHFSGSTRSVTLLKGEAYFQVVSDRTRPFTVITGNLTTTVLGTSFDIRAYEQEKDVQIALMTGKVSVADKRNHAPTLLLPHQWIRLDSGTNGEEKGVFDNDDEVAAWKTGALNFKDASFGDIAFEIGNKFNVTLVNNSDKHQWSYTGLFREESLEEVIETICQTEHLNYVFRENEILITNR
jgi:transmembrane sensor